MLQIISGKFFKSDFRQTRSGKGILYSNFSWVDSIQTCIATLEPVDTFGSSICSYIVNYENRIEGEPREGGLAPTGDWEIIRQFQLLCTFGLKAAFDVDKTSIELNCREKRKHSGDQYLPSRFTTRFFNPVIQGNNNEVQSFVQFVDKVIALPRKEYLAIIRCLTNFSDALQALNFNLDLAYSMLIYSLEALSQNFDGYNPIWQDYTQREEMDKLLLQIERDLADNIRNLLIKDRHLKLTKRFVDFIISYIDDSFYLQEANTVKNALRKSDTKQSLKNAYNFRSKYVHSLSPILDHLKDSHSAEGDFFVWDKQPYLTFNGLVRLTHHVINKFIDRQEYLEKEDYNYFQDIPGILTYQVAGDYWIGNNRDFSPSRAKEYLSGFLEHLQSVLISNQSLVNMDNILKKIESSIKSTNKKYQIPMLSLHRLFCCFTNNYERHSLLEKTYLNLLKECHIELMVTGLIFSPTLTWKSSECIEIYETYLKKKFNKDTLHIPQLIEIFLIIKIANIALKEKQVDIYKTWLNNACLEASGIPTIQNVIKNSMTQTEEIQLDEILKLLKQPS